jgi:hypothetical protein
MHKPQKFKYRDSLDKISDYGILKLKIQQENKKELEEKFKSQQSIIDNMDDTLTRLQISTEQDNNLSPQTTEEILKIDSFFKAYHNKKKYSKQITFKHLKSLRPSKTLKPIKKQEASNESYATRVNVNNYNNLFSFSNNIDLLNNFNADNLNTEFNVTIKNRLPYDEEDVITLANLVKKMDIKNNLKLAEVKKPRCSIQYSNATLNTYTSIEGNYIKPIETIESIKAPARYYDVDQENNKNNSFIKYKPRSNRNVDQIYKLNTIFETMQKQEKSAQDLLLNVGGKLAQSERHNYEVKLPGIRLDNINPVRLAKLNLKRVYK